MLKQLKELQEKRAKMLADLRGVLDGKDKLSAEAKETYDQALGEFREVTEQIERIEEVNRSTEDLSARDGEPTPPPDKNGSDDRDGVGGRGRPTREQLQVGYRDAFIRSIRTARAGQAMSLAPINEFMRENRAFTDDTINITTSTDGGLLAPDEFDAAVIRKAKSISVMRQLATIKQTSRGSYSAWVRDANPTAARTAEAGAFERGKLTFTEVSITPHKITIEIPITDEALSDVAVDIMAEISDAQGEEMGELGETWYVTGNGTNQAYGVVAGAAAGVTAAAVDAITPDELKSLKHSVSPKYRSGPKAGFLMNDSTFLSIATLQDGVGRWYLQESARGNGEYNFDGMSMKINFSDGVADIATGAVPILFGDFSRYIIVDRQTRYQVDPYSESSNGVVLVKAFIRTGGRLVLSEAVKKMTMA